MHTPKQNVAVFGLGLFGYQLAVRLFELGNHVLAVDKDPGLINQIKDHVTEAIVADVADEETLRELDVGAFDVIVLGMSSRFEFQILAATYMKRLGAKRIIAKASTEIQKEILQKIGADEVILPEKQIALKTAERISRPNLLEIFDIEEDIQLVSVKIPATWAGKSLKELDLRNRYGIVAIFFKPQHQRLRIITDPNLILGPEDELVLAGAEDALSRVA